MKFKPALLHFKFDNFASLDTSDDPVAYSELKIDCNGHKWYLSLWPGGYSDDDEPGWMSLFLNSDNEDRLDVRCTFSVKDANEKDVTPDKSEYDFKKFSYGDQDGTWRFMKRSVIFDTTNNILQNGALCIDVGIQVKDDKDHLFQPKSEHSSKMLDLLMSEEDADAFFVVGGMKVMVHKLIIKTYAPLLANHCDSEIADVSPEIFQLLLEHIYAGNYREGEQVLRYGKELIDAANKYELVELKMHVENVLVRERIITKQNVSDYIVFADAQCCPLLKEYAMSFFSAHCCDVLKSEHSKILRDSGDLMAELLLHVKRENDGSGATAMTVNELREELGKRKLDVDGCRDALIARLEDAKRQRTRLI